MDLIKISLCLFESMPSLTVKNLDPFKSSGNKSDIICKDSPLGFVCGTEVNNNFKRQICKFLIWINKRLYMKNNYHKGVTKYCGKLFKRLENNTSAGASSLPASSRL